MPRKAEEGGREAKQKKQLEKDIKNKISIKYMRKGDGFFVRELALFQGARYKKETSLPTFYQRPLIHCVT